MLPLPTSKFSSQAFGALDLLSGFQTALPTRSDPLNGIRARWNESGLGTPGDDKLPGPTATRDTVYDDRFFGLVMPVHHLQKMRNLRLCGNPVVGYVDVVVGKLIRHIPAVVELAAIDDGANLLFLVDVKNIRVRPPGGSNDAFHNPRERFGSFRLAFFRPIPRSKRVVGHVEFYARRMASSSQSRCRISATKNGDAKASP